MAKERKERFREPTKDSRKLRMEEEQIIHPISFEMSSTGETKKFEEAVVTLFGTKGIGKSTFGKVLGDSLAKKYNLDDSGTYFLMAEAPNNALSFRKTRIKTWPTFRDFIDKAENDRRFVRTVKMWVIDSIDALVKQGISTISYEWGVFDLTDEGYARAWQEMQAELLHQLGRLNDLGPGILILSHERDRPMSIGRRIVNMPSMDLSNSIANAVGYLCSMIIRMRYVEISRDKEEIGKMRCLSFTGSESEDVKDNLQVISPKYPDGTIKFETERQAVRKVLRCFDEKE
jgi:hypothetical protein